MYGRGLYVYVYIDMDTSEYNIQILYLFIIYIILYDFYSLHMSRQSGLRKQSQI